MFLQYSLLRTATFNNIQQNAWKMFHHKFQRALRNTGILVMHKNLTVKSEFHNSTRYLMLLTKLQDLLYLNVIIPSCFLTCSIHVVSKVTKLSEICVGIWSLTSALLTLGGLQYGYVVYLSSSLLKPRLWNGEEWNMMLLMINLSQKAQHEPLKCV